MEYKKITDATKNGIIENAFDVMVHDEIANRHYKNVSVRDVTKNVIIIKHSEGEIAFVSDKNLFSGKAVIKQENGYKVLLKNGRATYLSLSGAFIENKP